MSTGTSILHRLPTPPHSGGWPEECAQLPQKALKSASSQIVFAGIAPDAEWDEIDDHAKTMESPAGKVAEHGAETTMLSCCMLGITYAKEEVSR